jgi:short subunit dehydrogenase-like uncharacterized protein
MAKNKFDIILYGATSFVGQIVTRYMNEQFADRSIKWAIAGRSLRVRTHLSHQMTVAAMAMVAMKFLMFRSKRVATRRQSLKRQNIRSTTLRCL